MKSLYWFEGNRQDLLDLQMKFQVLLTIQRLDRVPLTMNLMAALRSAKVLREDPSLKASIITQNCFPESLPRDDWEAGVQFIH